MLVGLAFASINGLVPLPWVMMGAVGVGRCAIAFVCTISGLF